MLFLLIGFVGITILAFVMSYLINIFVAILIVFIYLILLAFTFHRNNIEL